MILLEGISFDHPGGCRVFRHLDLRLDGGSATTIIGPSGCGKTTLLYLMAGLLRPQSGAASVFGMDPAQVRRDMALIPQDYGLFPWLTAEANVALGLKLRGMPKGAARAVAKEGLALMGLSGLGRRYPSQLSGGQRQRVAIARALAMEPKCLFMDEPFSALDALTREELQEVLLSEWRQRGFTMVLVTHSIEEAVYLGQKVLVLAPGRPPTVLESPGMGQGEYRQSSAYFQRTVDVRRALEGSGTAPAMGVAP